jgi:sporulation protein YlmC with PRC-barrel domain
MHHIRACLGIASLLLWVVSVTPGAAAQDVQPPLYKMRSIIGHTVENQHGKDLGHIEEVVIDAATGDIAYAVLTFGAFLGMGGKLFALPWHVLQQSGKGSTFRLEMTEAQLEKAPGFDKDQWPDMEERHWQDAIHAYYGRPPYVGKELPPQSASEPAGSVPHRLLRAGYVLKGKVINTRGQRLGDIEEVVVDAATGQVAYAVLSVGEFLGVGEKLFAIPWLALRQSAGLGTFTLDVEKDTLQKAGGFDKDHWPNMADPRWQTAVHSEYKQQPYWERRQPPGMPEVGKR